MRVSQRLDYAVRALVALAESPAGHSIAAGELADRLGLPRRFVEQQITALARSGLVSSRRGPSGGCTLATPAEQITVYDIVVALQGDVLDVPRVTGSAVSEMWVGVAESLATSLKAVSVAQLVDRQRELKEAESPMYHI